MKKFIILGLALIFLMGCSNFPTGNVVSDNLDDFAKYLTEEGVVMVGAEWCGHCQNQKAMFGDSFQYINYVDSVYYPEEAASYGVSGYPTWILADGTQLPGEQSIENLKEKTGYND
ncbi:MAG: thioredoxin domain-containing protein [archaeon]